VGGEVPKGTAVMENDLKRGSLSTAVAAWMAESGSDTMKRGRAKKGVVTSTFTPSRENTGAGGPWLPGHPRTGTTARRRQTTAAATDLSRLSAAFTEHSS
jgi:hypothetical protein